MHYIIILYIALPAFIANMMPVIAAKLGLWKGLAVPIDLGRSWRGRRILGDHKTWRGLVAGIAGAAGAATIQFALGKFFSFPDGYFGDIYTATLFGFLTGLGALIGDAAESAVKRQLDIASGRPFFPFDQVDYIFGFLVFTALVFPWELRDVLFLVIFALAANPAVNLFAYATGIKETYW